jgi:hypothetical protein
MSNKFLTTVDLTGNNLINVGTATIFQANLTGGTISDSPVNPTDITNKSYVDGVAQGLSIKDSVAAGTVMALPSNTYNNGSSGVGATLTATANGILIIDGYTAVTNDRLLIKNEVTAANNGIYYVVQPGSVSTPYILERTTDMDLPSQIPGAFTFVLAGTVNAASGWVVNALGPFTIGTTAINWTQFSGAGALTYTAPILVTGNNISIGLDNVTVWNNGSNDLAVKSSSTAGQTLISQGSGSAAWGALPLSNSAAVTGNLSLANGGTSASLTASNGGIFYSTASAGAILSGTATADQVLLSGSSSAPTWSAATYPSSTTINQLLYSSAANTIVGLSSANNGVLVTSGSGVPSIGTTLPTTVQDNITAVGLVGSGTWEGATIGILYGGTGQTTANAALNALLPSQTGHTNYYLQTNGTNTSWQPVTAGTVSKYATSIGDGSSTSFTITHSLGSLDAEIQVYETATGNVVFPDMQNTTTNTSTITFSVAPTTNQYRVVVMA